MIYYAIYSADSFRVAQKGCCPASMVPSIADHHHVVITKEEYDLLDGVDAIFNPVTEKVEITSLARDLFAASSQWEKIRSIRDSLQESPVTLSDGWRIDADRDSVLRLQERVDQWGVGTHTMTPDGRQLWKGANNDIRLFTQSEFIALVDEVRAKRALKVDANFAYAESIRAQLPIAADHPAFSPVNWPG